MKTIRELNILNELSASLHTSLDRESIFENIVDKTRELLKAEKAAIVLVDRYGRVVDFYTSMGPAGNCKHLLTGTLKRAMEEITTLRTDDVTKEPAFVGFPPNHPQIKSILMVPMLLRGEPIGAIIATDKKGGSFTETDEDLLLNLAFHSALAIEKVQFYEEILKMASTDGLTGLINHRTFQEKLQIEIDRARRFGHKVSLLMIDIDHFKKFNDTYGHTNGDEVLKRVACILQDNIRSIDLAARYGGEEFAVVLPQVSLPGAIVVAERIRKKTEEHELVFNGKKEHVTVSIGVATFPDDASDREELIDNADKALYLAKRTGRNRVCAFSEEIVNGKHEPNPTNV